MHYMDHLRALAMLAGVLFHAALAYSPFDEAASSRPADAGRLGRSVDALAWFVHMFRMPLFFVIAGYLRGAAGAQARHRRHVAQSTARACCCRS